MSDINTRLDEILENVLDDATLWYIGRINEKEYWETHKVAKQAIKQLMADEFEKLIGEEENLKPFSVSKFNNWVAPREMLKDELRQKLEEWKK